MGTKKFSPLSVRVENLALQNDSCNYLSTLLKEINIDGVVVPVNDQIEMLKMSTQLSAELKQEEDYLKAYVLSIVEIIEESFKQN